MSLTRCLGVSDRPTFRRERGHSSHRLYYWEEEFKHSKDDLSNCVYIYWDSKNPLTPLFAAMFVFFLLV